MQLRIYSQVGIYLLFNFETNLTFQFAETKKPTHGVKKNSICLHITVGISFREIQIYSLDVPTPHLCLYIRKLKKA
jgi:hypothetical protein